MSSVRSVTYVSGPDNQIFGSGGTTRTPDTRIMMLPFPRMGRGLA
jgi:hypothetical protein